MILSLTTHYENGRKKYIKFYTKNGIEEKFYDINGDIIEK